MSAQPHQGETNQTAQDYVTKGLQLLEGSKRREALECFSKAIDLDPTCGIAYSRRGQIIYSLKNKEKAVVDLQKGLSLAPDHSEALLDQALLSRPADCLRMLDEFIQLNPQSAKCHACKADQLLSLGDNEAALIEVGKAIELDPNDPWSYVIKCSILTILSRLSEARESIEKALALDKSYARAYICRGMVERGVNEFSKAVEDYDRAIELDPNYALAYSSKAIVVFNNLKQREAGIELLNKAISLEENDQRYRTKGLFLKILKKYEEALESFEKSISLSSNQAYVWCQKGEVLNKLGRTEEALESFKKAHDLILTDPTSTVLLQEKFINWAKNTIKSALELHAISKETEAEVKKLDENNPLSKKFRQSVKALMEKKNQATKDLIDQFGNDNAEVDKTNQEIEKLKQEFSEQLRLLKEQVAANTTGLKDLNTKVETLARNYDELKAELSTKMEDYKKKLELELSKLDVTEDQGLALREYFNAFVETFSSLYVTSQVIQSGQIKLDTGTSLGSILSVAASFAPFFGDALSSGIKTIDDFFHTKEMISNARKMLTLANDSSDLSQIIGEVAYNVIIKNPKKRTQIIEVTDESLEEKSNRLFEKIASLCTKIGEAKDAYLYGKLYKTTAARLGHLDANKLIEYWMKGTPSPFGINTTFIKILTTDLETKEDRTTSRLPETIASSNKGSCCNVF